MDINGSEFLVIALIALVLVGPERLPQYVRGLRSVVLRLRALIKDGQEVTLKMFERERSFAHDYGLALWQTCAEAAAAARTA